MFEKPQASHTLGLDFDDFSLKGAALSFSRGKLKFDAFFDYLVAPSAGEDVHVKPLYSEEKRAQLRELAARCLVVSAVPAADILVRPLELRLKKNKDIDAALAFQVEPILPYPPENGLIDKIVISKDAEGSRLSVLALRKDHLSHHLAQWQSLEIEPEIVSAAPQALALFANHFVAKDNPFYALHLGIANSFCILMDNGKMVAAQVIPGGLKELMQLVAVENNTDLPTAYSDLLKGTALLPLQDDQQKFKAPLDTLRIATTRTIYALAKQFKSKEIQEVFVTGPGAVLPGLAESLCRSMNKTQVFIQEPVDAVETSKELLLYALPIGQALSALSNCSEQINFRQQEFVYPEPWKRIKQPILQYFMLSVGVAIALSLMGKAYVHHQEGEIKKQYLELLDVMNKPYNEFEKEFGAKMRTSLDTNPADSIPIADLTQDEIKSRLSSLEKEIQATPQIFPLQPNVPLVSDVLAWISSHPTIVNKLTPTEIPNNTLHIESFSYTLVKRPEPTKKLEKYQVKVEVEFSTPTPKMAREFHDALIAPNEMVDPKGEIKWSSNRDRYRTSFYLKDKTLYPNP